MIIFLHYLYLNFLIEVRGNAEEKAKSPSFLSFQSSLSSCLWPVTELAIFIFYTQIYII